MAATTLAPAYQAPPGLTKAETVAHLHGHINTLNDHIGKLVRKHENVVKTVQAGASKGVEGLKKVAGQVHYMAQSAFAVGTGSALGYVNGRYGGEKGYCTKYGVTLDAGVAAMAHIGGFALAFVDPGENAEHAEKLRIAVQSFHTVGDTALGAAMYRLAHEKGAEAARRAGQPAVAPPPAVQPNGAPAQRGGTVYQVASK